MHRLFCGNLSISPLFYNLLKFPRNLDARSSEPPPFPLCNIDSFTLPHPDFVVLLFCNVTQKAEKLIFHLLQVPLLCLEFYHICFKNSITLCTRGKPGYRRCLLIFTYSKVFTRCINTRFCSLSYCGTSCIASHTSSSRGHHLPP